MSMLTMLRLLMSLAGVDSAYLVCSSLSFSIKQLSQVSTNWPKRGDRETEMEPIRNRWQQWTKYSYKLDDQKICHIVTLATFQVCIWGCCHFYKSFCCFSSRGVVATARAVASWHTRLLQTFSCPCFPCYCRQSTYKYRYCRSSRLIVATSQPPQCFVASHTMLLLPLMSCLFLSCVFCCHSPHVVVITS
jgi:hypothetical protein